MSLEDLDPQVAETLKSLHLGDDEPANLSEADIQEGIRMRDALGQWQSESFATLEVIRRRLLSDDPPTSPPEIAEVIAAVARFDGEDEFILPELKAISQDILSRISPLPEVTRRETVSLVLSTHIKPLFLPTQHPMVNQETGRRVHVQEGSRVAYPEFNDDQVWKAAGRGCWNTLRWTVSQLQRDDFEKLWPLLIPPLMTLLDDYQTIFRIKGIQVLHKLLEQVDGKLLKRTGIGSLFSNSLLNSINRSTDPEISLILPLASRTLQKLIELTTDVGSRERFDRLCECLSTGVVGGVWIFAGEKLEAMEASIETLLPLVDALDIGCCRYLKALVPQLTEVLAPKPVRPHSIRLINLSTDCLLRLIIVCKPRIHAWKDVILDALLRSWVWAKEDPKAEELGVAEVQADLCRLCKALADACPSLYTDDIPALLEWNRELLSDLLPVNHAL